MQAADIVFHVLAHVRPQLPLSASLYNPAYINFCSERLGDASGRVLGQDALELSRLLGNHDTLCRVQLLAWLFDGQDESSRYDRETLDNLPPDCKCRREILAHLQEGDRTAVELVRCAVALERPHYKQLPLADPGGEQMMLEHLAMLIPFAPRLRQSRISCCRALGRRGRAFGDSILVGLPEDGAHAPTVEHAVVQAAHEAIVQEVNRAARMTFLEAEHAALTLLRRRVFGTDQEAPHARWLQRLNLAPWGGVDALVLDALSARARQVLLRLSD